LGAVTAVRAIGLGKKEQWYIALAQKAMAFSGD